MRTLVLLLSLCFALFAAEPPVVGYLPIEGEIDQAKAAYFKHALERAHERKVTHLVVHMTTPGGELGAGMQMLNAALAQPKDAPRLIAFVDDHSLSAGSLIAYGHDEILVTSKAMLGDIGVITIGSDGKIEYLPEKIETVVRTLLRNAAQNRGWNQAKLVKMTARTQELYRFDLADGKHEFVIQDDLSTFLAAHPDLKTENKVVVLGNDRLLSYTAREAVDNGMATALVADLDAVYARLGVTKSAVIDLSPSQSEKMSWSLAGWAPLLLAAALLCVFLEFKMPAGGLWLALGGLLGVGFFVCQFYLDLASYIEVVLLLVGAALIVVELTVLSLHGLLAALGGLLMLAGIILAFMPNATKFTPDAVGWNDLLTAALAQAIWAIGVLSLGVVAGIAALPRIALKTGLADSAAIDGTSAGTDELDAVSLVGQIATTRTLLRPSGQVELRGRIFTAITEHGEHVALGVAVTIVGARFGELIVAPPVTLES